MSKLHLGLAIILAAVLTGLAITLITGEWILMLPVVALAGGLLLGVGLRAWWEHGKREWEEPEVEEKPKPKPVRRVVPPEDDPNWWGYTHGDGP